MSQYSSSLKLLGFKDIAQQKPKGRISSLTSISRQLFKAHYDCYHPRVSRQLATALKRYINTRPKHERKTEEFVGEIRRKLLCLHEYNLQIAKVKFKYPRSEQLDAVLVQYIELECELLYNTHKKNDEQHENNVKQRILRLLQVILYDALHNSEVLLRTTIIACDKAILKLFANVRADCVSENKVVASVIEKLLERLGLMEEVNQLKGKNIPFHRDVLLRDPLVHSIRQNLATSDYESDIDDDSDEEMDSPPLINDDVFSFCKTRPCEPQSLFRSAKDFDKNSDAGRIKKFQSPKNFESEQFPLIKFGQVKNELSNIQMNKTSHIISDSFCHNRISSVQKCDDKVDIHFANSKNFDSLNASGNVCSSNEEPSSEETFQHELICNEKTGHITNKEYETQEGSNNSEVVENFSSDANTFLTDQNVSSATTNSEIVTEVDPYEELEKVNKPISPQNEDETRGNEINNSVSDTEKETNVIERSFQPNEAAAEHESNVEIVENTPENDVPKESVPEISHYIINPEEVETITNSKEGIEVNEEIATSNQADIARQSSDVCNENIESIKEKTTKYIDKQPINTTIDVDSLPDPIDKTKKAVNYEVLGGVVTIEISDDDDDGESNYTCVNHKDDGQPQLTHNSTPYILQSNEIKSEENEANHSPNFYVSNSGNSDSSFLGSDRGSKSSGSTTLNIVKSNSNDSVKEAESTEIIISDSEDDLIEAIEQLPEVSSVNQSESINSSKESELLVDSEENGDINSADNTVLNNDVVEERESLVIANTDNDVISDDVTTVNINTVEENQSLLTSDKDSIINSDITSENIDTVKEQDCLVITDEDNIVTDDAHEDSDPANSQNEEAIIKISESDQKEIEDDSQETEDANEEIDDDSKITEDANEKIDDDSKITEDVNEKIDDDSKKTEDANEKIDDSKKTEDTNEKIETDSQEQSENVAVAPLNVEFSKNDERMTIANCLLALGSGNPMEEIKNKVEKQNDIGFEAQEIISENVGEPQNNELFSIKCTEINENHATEVNVECELEEFVTTTTVEISSKYENIDSVSIDVVNENQNTVTASLRVQIEEETSHKENFEKSVPWNVPSDEISHTEAAVETNLQDTTESVENSEAFPDGYIPQEVYSSFLHEGMKHNLQNLEIIRDNITHEENQAYTANLADSNEIVRSEILSKQNSIQQHRTLSIEDSSEVSLKENISEEINRTSDSSLHDVEHLNNEKKVKSSIINESFYCKSNITPTLNNVEYIEHDVEKKVGEAELLLNISASQETLILKNEMSAPVDYRSTNITLSPNTSKRRKSKIRMESKKKILARETLPRAVKQFQKRHPIKPKTNSEELEIKRITRNRISKPNPDVLSKELVKPSRLNRHTDSKYKPHDFISIKNPTLPPPTNNVYAQKRLMETNTTSEDSNDSCESTLFIDLSESSKQAEKPTIKSIYEEETIDDLLEFVTTEDKTAVCISIPENEENCNIESFHILKQMEDFVDNNRKQTNENPPENTEKIELIKDSVEVTDLHNNNNNIEQNITSEDSSNIQNVVLKENIEEKTESKISKTTDHSIENILGKTPSCEVKNSVICVNENDGALAALKSKGELLPQSEELTCNGITVNQHLSLNTAEEKKDKENQEVIEKGISNERKDEDMESQEVIEKDISNERKEQTKESQEIIEKEISNERKDQTKESQEIIEKDISNERKDKDKESQKVIEKVISNERKDKDMESEEVIEKDIISSERKDEDKERQEVIEKGISNDTNKSLDIINEPLLTQITVNVETTNTCQSQDEVSDKVIQEESEDYQSQPENLSMNKSVPVRVDESCEKTFKTKAAVKSYEDRPQPNSFIFSETSIGDKLDRSECRIRTRSRSKSSEQTRQHQSSSDRNRSLSVDFNSLSMSTEEQVSSPSINDEVNSSLESNNSLDENVHISTNISVVMEDNSVEENSKVPGGELLSQSKDLEVQNLAPKEETVAAVSEISAISTSDNIQVISNENMSCELKETNSVCTVVEMKETVDVNDKVEGKKQELIQEDVPLVNDKLVSAVTDESSKNEVVEQVVAQLPDVKKEVIPMEVKNDVESNQINDKKEIPESEKELSSKEKEMSSDISKTINIKKSSEKSYSDRSSKPLSKVSDQEKGRALEYTIKKMKEKIVGSEKAKKEQVSLNLTTEVSKTNASPSEEPISEKKYQNTSDTFASKDKNDNGRKQNKNNLEDVKDKSAELSKRSSDHHKKRRSRSSSKTRTSDKKYDETRNKEKSNKKSRSRSSSKSRSIEKHSKRHSDGEIDRDRRSKSKSIEEKERFNHSKEEPNGHRKRDTRSSSKSKSLDRNSKQSFVGNSKHKSDSKEKTTDEIKDRHKKRSSRSPSKSRTVDPKRKQNHLDKNSDTDKGKIKDKSDDIKSKSKVENKNKSKIEESLQTEKDKDIHDKTDKQTNNEKIHQTTNKSYRNRSKQKSKSENNYVKSVKQNEKNDDSSRLKSKDVFKTSEVHSKSSSHDKHSSEKQNKEEHFKNSDKSRRSHSKEKIKIESSSRNDKKDKGSSTNKEKQKVIEKKSNGQHEEFIGNTISADKPKENNKKMNDCAEERKEITKTSEKDKQKDNNKKSTDLSEKGQERMTSKADGNKISLQNKDDNNIVTKNVKEHDVVDNKEKQEILKIEIPKKRKYDDNVSIEKPSDVQTSKILKVDNEDGKQLLAVTKPKTEKLHKTSDEPQDVSDFTRTSLQDNLEVTAMELETPEEAAHEIIVTTEPNNKPIETQGPENAIASDEIKNVKPENSRKEILLTPSLTISNIHIDITKSQTIPLIEKEISVPVDVNPEKSLKGSVLTPSLNIKKIHMDITKSLSIPTTEKEIEVPIDVKPEKSLKESVFTPSLNIKKVHMDITKSQPIPIIEKEIPVSVDVNPEKTRKENILTPSLTISNIHMDITKSQPIPIIEKEIPVSVDVNPEKTRKENVLTPSLTISNIHMDITKTQPIPIIEKEIPAPVDIILKDKMPVHSSTSKENCVLEIKSNNEMSMLPPAKIPLPNEPVPDISSSGSIYVNNAFTSSSENIHLQVLSPMVNSKVKNFVPQEADIALLTSVNPTSSIVENVTTSVPCNVTTPVTASNVQPCSASGIQDKTCLFAFNEDPVTDNRENLNTSDLFDTSIGLEDISPTKLRIGSNQSLDLMPSTSIAEMDSSISREINNPMNLVQNLVTSTINFISDVPDNTEIEVQQTNKQPSFTSNFVGGTRVTEIRCYVEKESTADHNYTLGDPLLSGNNEDKNILTSGLSLSNSPEEFALNEGHLEELSFNENNFIEENGTLEDLGLFIPCKKEKPDFVDNMIDDAMPKAEDIQNSLKHLNNMLVDSSQGEQPKTISVDNTIDHPDSTGSNVNFAVDYAINKLLYYGGGTSQNNSFSTITDIENINIMESDVTNLHLNKETIDEIVKSQDETSAITSSALPSCTVVTSIPTTSMCPTYPTFIANDNNQKVVVEQVEQCTITALDQLKKDYINETNENEKTKPAPCKATRDSITKVSTSYRPTKFATFLQTVKRMDANKSEAPKVKDEMENYTVRRHNRTPVFPPKKKTATQQHHSKSPTQNKKNEILSFETNDNKSQTKTDVNSEFRIRVKTDLIKPAESNSNINSDSFSQLDYIHENDQNIASEVVLPFSRPSPSEKSIIDVQDKSTTEIIPKTDSVTSKSIKHARFDKSGNDYIMENILNTHRDPKAHKTQIPEPKIHEKKTELIIDVNKKRKYSFVDSSEGSDSEKCSKRGDKRQKKSDDESEKIRFSSDHSKSHTKKQLDIKPKPQNSEELFDKLLREGPTNKIFVQRITEQQNAISKNENSQSNTSPDLSKSRGYSSAPDHHRKDRISQSTSSQFHESSKYRESLKHPYPEGDKKNDQRKVGYYHNAPPDRRYPDKRHGAAPVGTTSPKRYIRSTTNPYSSKSDPIMSRDQSYKSRDRRLSTEHITNLLPNSHKNEGRTSQEDDKFHWLDKLSGTGLFEETPSNLFMPPGSKQEDTSLKK